MIKHSEERLISINNNISSINEYSSKLGEIQSQDKEVFWKALKNIIERSIKGHKASILEKLDQRTEGDLGEIFSDLKYRAGAIKAYSEIMNLVDKNQDAQDEANAKITELKAIAKEIQDNIDMQ